jgi:hypothetical protein
VFVVAGGGVGAAAGAEFDFAVFEVVEELVPFGVCDFAVFVAGSLLAAARDEGAVVFDDVVVVDSDVALIALTEIPQVCRAALGRFT